MLQLILPTQTYKKEFYSALEEMKDYYPGPKGIVDLAKTDFDTFVQHAIDYSQGKNLEPGHVPASSLWLMENNEFIGAVSIRHELNDFLKKFGGHVGYAIRPSKRNQGYGTKALALALTYLKEKGVKYAFVTCDEDNIASQKIIKQNGGVLQDIVEIPENPGKRTMRWWIELIPTHE